NSPADRFANFSNNGTLNVAPGLTAPVTFNGFINQGSGSVTVGAGSTVNAANFQSYGLLNIPNGPTAAAATRLVNTGASNLFLNGGSRTFISTPGGNGFSGINLNGHNAIVAGGLLVNNGIVFDGSS